MYYYIKGELVTSTLNMAVVDAGGVGYKMTISENTYRSLPRRGDKPVVVTLYTHLSVREDGIELFGFESERELSSFKMLLSVSGVGPKAAMAILSLLTPEKFTLAVCTEDRKTISKANGIGPKTAARIILELRDKMMAEGTLPSLGSAPVSIPGDIAAPAASSGKLNEAQEALLVLGYSRSEVLGVLHTIDTSAMEVEDIIRTALKKLMR